MDKWKLVNCKSSCPPVLQTDAEVAAIKKAIDSATNLQEIERLNQILLSGKMNGLGGGGEYADQLIVTNERELDNFNFIIISFHYCSGARGNGVIRPHQCIIIGIIILYVNYLWYPEFTRSKLVGIFWHDLIIK